MKSVLIPLLSMWLLISIITGMTCCFEWMNMYMNRFMSTYNTNQPSGSEKYLFIIFLERIWKDIFISLQLKGKKNASKAVSEKIT